MRNAMGQKNVAVPKKRTYGDACGVARALDLVGERWALMVVRELLLGPKRFTDIRAGLPHLSPDVLAQRLRELEETGVVSKRKLPPPAASQVYQLTDWGRELESVLIALGRWGARCGPPAEGLCMSIDSHMVSLSTLFDPELAGDFVGTFEIHLGEDSFNVVIADGQIDVARGEADSPDATIVTDTTGFLDLFHQHRTLDQVVTAGDAAITGNKKLVARLVKLFPLPAPAAVAEAITAAAAH
jgi:DNA-binding HxlR family transcriptional regulator